MKREEITEKVIACIEEIEGGKLSYCNETLSFANDLEFDSLDAVEFIMELEQAFNISISNSELYQLDNEATTLSNVVDFISDKLEVQKNDSR